MTLMRLRLHMGSSFFFIFGTPKPHRNPEVLPQTLRSLTGTRRLQGNPEVLPQILYIGPGIVWGTLGFLFRSGACIWTRTSLGTRNILLFVGSVLRLPRQDYYWYLFGFRILPLGSWPLSISYVVFYFCRKSLTGLEGAGVSVMTQVQAYAAFHVWRSKIQIDPCISQYFLNEYIDTTQITLRSELLFQIRGSIVVLRDRIHKKLGNLLNLVKLLILSICCFMGLKVNNNLN